MKLLSMNLNNFRCFANTDIKFDPQLTVFVGANGSGKTSVLEGAAILLEQMPLFIANSYKNHIHRSDIRLGSTSSKLNYTVSNENQRYTLRFNFEKEQTDVLDRNLFTNNIDFINKIQNVRLPVVVYYSAKRVINKYYREEEAHATLDYAYKNAFEPQIDFSSTLTWFIEKSSEEALEVVHTKNLSHHIPELEAVRQAVSTALGKYNKPFVAGTPLQLFITKEEAPDIRLNLQQLSDGYRTMLALIMDLARRIALVHESTPLTSGEKVLHEDGIVLIDEIELHLHPSWQQTVLPTIMEIFPNVQFIVTTHSPHVITSIEAKHVYVLDNSGMVYNAPQGTWGAEASRIMKQVFEVDNRPPSQARNDLEEYSTLVYDDKWNTDRALELRMILDKRYGCQEPELTMLDMYIENRKWEKNEEGVIHEDNS